LFLGKVLFSFKEEEHCRGDLDCRDWGGKSSHNKLEENQPPGNIKQPNILKQQSECYILFLQTSDPTLII